MNDYLPNLWSANWFPLAAVIRSTSTSNYNGGSASNYIFPVQQNWDGGSAQSGTKQNGSIDGGNA
jgi:hypothetical protein